MAEDAPRKGQAGDRDAADAAAVLAALAPVTVICGHYGVGKTNLALNLALDAAAAGYEVTLADLDVVNPYFRASEYRGALEAAGARLVAPVFSEAGASLDVPSLTGGVAAAIDEAHARALDAAGEARPFRLIIDAGGDDVGATALGRFAARVAAGPHALWYVANPYRSLTAGPEDAVAVLREVEAKSRLVATAVAANPHLKAETDAGVVARAIPEAREVARLAGLPLAFVTAPKRLARQERDELRGQAGGALVYPVGVVVRTPWETES